MTIKKQVGRPKFKITDETKRTVEKLSGLGLPQEQIAETIGCSVDTMVKYLQHEITIGKAKANSSISQKLFEKAMSGDSALLIFYAKTQMRWKETDKLEITGKDDGPIEISDAKSRLLSGIVVEYKKDE
jgi:hypothetical protein